MENKIIIPFCTEYILLEGIYVKLQLYHYLIVIVVNISHLILLIIWREGGEKKWALSSYRVQDCVSLEIFRTSQKMQNKVFGPIQGWTVKGGKEPLATR